MFNLKPISAACYGNLRSIGVCLVALLFIAPFLFYLLAPLIYVEANYPLIFRPVQEGKGTFLQNGVDENVAATLSDRNWATQLAKYGIPNVVHVMWCRNSSIFEFKNFLSIQSVLAVFEPALVHFHFANNEPTSIDEFRYNTWLDDLKNSVPNFISHYSNDSSLLSNYCRQKATPTIELNSRGLFVSADFVITSSVKIAPRLERFKEQNDAKDSNTSLTITCTSFSAVRQLATFDELPICFATDEEVEFFPASFFEAKNQLAKFVRIAIYKTEEPLILQPNPATLAPLLCHYIWLGGGTVEFLLYLSILSCLNVVKADSVLVHGDMEPRGELWTELVQNYPGRVVYLLRPQQNFVFGRPVTKLSPMSDVLRMDILLKYGGIYADWDAVFVKPLDTSVRQYDAVVSLDWPDHLAPYPDTLNLGVMVTKPNAVYIKRLQESLHDFVDGVGPTLWCYICLKAYKIYERYPETVKIDRHLQVIAYQGNYHPSWLDGYKEVRFEPPAGSFDWKRGETFALHWTWPTPVELRALKFLRKSNTTAAQVGRHILASSGIDAR